MSLNILKCILLFIYAYKGINIYHILLFVINSNYNINKSVYKLILIFNFHKFWYINFI